MTNQPQFEFCAAFVDALAANGVRHAAVSPGSRNTPLLIALATHPAIELSVHIDERSGAFFALGMAKATGRPTVLCCTSGTAATEYLPALTEARMAHTPLIAVTADRPPELQDRGAPQTINQTNLYGSAVKWFYDTGVPETADDADHLARQAVATALEAPAGPVHINVPLRDPLVPAAKTTMRPTRSGMVPAVPKLLAEESDLNSLAEALSARRTLLVAGRTQSQASGAAILELAAALNAVVVADPQSDARFPGVAPDHLVSLADLILSADAAPLAPEAVVHFGAIHTSKPLNQWISGLGVPVTHVHDGQWADPLGIASVLVADPAATAVALAKLVEPAEQHFLSSWRSSDDRAAAALAAIPADSEPAIAAAVVGTVPSSAWLVAGSSMPIRLIDSYGLARDKKLSVIANRGANGIDGTIATTVGVSRATGSGVTALLGDLTFLADVGSLRELAGSEAPTTIVVINNNGGGIFDFLPQADGERIEPGDYERFIRAPHGLELYPIAAAYGIESHLASGTTDLAEMLAVPAMQPRVIEIRTEPTSGPAAREAVLAALAG